MDVLRLLKIHHKSVKEQKGGTHTQTHTRGHGPAMDVITAGPEMNRLNVIACLACHTLTVTQCKSQ